MINIGLSNSRISRSCSVRGQAMTTCVHGSSTVTAISLFWTGWNKSFKKNSHVCNHQTSVSQELVHFFASVGWSFLKSTTWSNAKMRSIIWIQNFEFIWLNLNLPQSRLKAASLAIRLLQFFPELCLRSPQIKHSIASPSLLTIERHVRCRS